MNTPRDVTVKGTHKETFSHAQNEAEGNQNKKYSG
jgi:hypothetical protein